jgi:hypothetical protein
MVGIAVAEGVGEIAASVGGGAGVGVGVKVVEGEASVGKNGVAVGRDAAPTGVEVASELETPSWLNRKAPSSIPTLMSVTTSPPISCPRPASRSFPAPGFSPTSTPLTRL